jgi:hypothetical protein
MTNNNNNNNKITLDNTSNLMYNTSMTNNDTNNKGNDMIKMTHNFRVYMHANGSFDAFANFTSIQEALDYMRNWTDKTDNWFIYDENEGRRFKLINGSLTVVDSIGSSI